MTSQCPSLTRLSASNIALAEELEESIRSELLSDPRKRKDVEEEALKDKEIPANDDIVVLADVK